MTVEIDALWRRIRANNDRANIVSKRQAEAQWLPDFIDCGVSIIVLSYTHSSYEVARKNDRVSSSGLGNIPSLQAAFLGRLHRRVEMQKSRRRSQRNRSTWRRAKSDGSARKAGLPLGAARKRNGTKRNGTERRKKSCSAQSAAWRCARRASTAARATSASTILTITAG